MAPVFFEHLDMSPPEFGGDFDTALENYYHLAKRIGIRDGRVLKQVHGTGIVMANDRQDVGSVVGAKDGRGATGARQTRPILPLLVGEGDALWTSEPGVWVGVFTADCLSILLDAGDRVMAVHAGWRGLAGGIVGKSVEFLGGAAAIRSTTLGPAAKKCCYEVGDGVVAVLRAAGIEPIMSGRNLDMVETAEQELHRLGIATIARSEPFGCTICDKRFRSFRRDGDRAGRSLSGIALEKDS